MSRSVRKTPIVGNTVAESEKEDKKLFSRRQRKSIKQQLRTTDEPVEKEHKRSGQYLFEKDGKHYLKRRDEEYEKCMRK